MDPQARCALLGANTQTLSVSTVLAQLTSAKIQIHVQAKNLGEKVLDLPLPKGSLPHLDHIASMFPLFHHTSIRKVNCNFPKKEGSSERNYSWLRERQNLPQICCFEGSTAQISPPSPSPRAEPGAAHPPGHACAHTHAHTASVCIFFFLAKK